MIRGWLVGIALVVSPGASGCSHDHPTGADPVASSPAPSASVVAAGARAFGEHCVEDGECAAAVCFHKRLKTAGSGPEQRGSNDAVEPDGYCSLRCNSDADCPSPPSSGRCGARGMCKRP